MQAVLFHWNIVLIGVGWNKTMVCTTKTMKRGVHLTCRLARGHLCTEVKWTTDHSSGYRRPRRGDGDEVRSTKLEEIAVRVHSHTTRWFRSSGQLSKVQPTMVLFRRSQGAVCQCTGCKVDWFNINKPSTSQRVHDDMKCDYRCALVTWISIR